MGKITNLVIHLIMKIFLKELISLFDNPFIIISFFIFWEILKFFWKIYVIFFFFYFIKNSIYVFFKKKKKLKKTNIFLKYIDLQSYIAATLTQKTSIRLKLKMLNNLYPRILFVYFFHININFIKLYNKFIKLLIKKFKCELASKSRWTQIKNFHKLLSITLKQLINEEITNITLKFHTILNQ